MNEDELEAFVDQSVAFMNQAITSCNEIWDFPSYANYFVDQETGILSFIDGSKPPIGCRFQFVGTYQAASGAWRWSWANPSLDESLKNRMQEVKDFGEKHAIKLIMEDTWQCNNEDAAWFMTAISTKILNGISAYRAPMSDSLYSYTVITSVDWI
ncbi:MAG: hypothetical protein K2Z81_28895 [Cyanobacteria bacterium]|nr:hypothetical protein [Cyanobacteriota bacterium]